MRWSSQGFPGIVLHPSHVSSTPDLSPERTSIQVVEEELRDNQCAESCEKPECSDNQDNVLVSTALLLSPTASDPSRHPVFRVDEYPFALALLVHGAFQKADPTPSPYTHSGLLSTDIRNLLPPYLIPSLTDTSRTRQNLSQSHTAIAIQPVLASTPTACFCRAAALPGPCHSHHIALVLHLHPTLRLFQLRSLARQHLRLAGTDRSGPVLPPPCPSPPTTPLIKVRNV